MLGGAPDRRRVKVGRVVLGQDLSLGHFGDVRMKVGVDVRKMRLLKERKAALGFADLIAIAARDKDAPHVIVEWSGD